jgi:hypothetical protein
MENIIRLDDFEPENVELINYSRNHNNLLYHCPKRGKIPLMIKTKKQNLTVSCDSLIDNLKIFRFGNFIVLKYLIPDLTNIVMGYYHNINNNTLFDKMKQLEKHLNHSDVARRDSDLLTQSSEDLNLHEQSSEDSTQINSTNPITLYESFIPTDNSYETPYIKIILLNESKTPDEWYPYSTIIYNRYNKYNYKLKIKENDLKYIFPKNVDVRFLLHINIIDRKIHLNAIQLLTYSKELEKIDYCSDENSNKLSINFNYRK